MSGTLKTYESKIKCRLLQISLDRNQVRLVLPRGESADKAGVIAVATRVCPDCSNVLAIAADGLFTLYRKSGPNWQVSSGKMSPPVT